MDNVSKNEILEKIIEEAKLARKGGMETSALVILLRERGLNKPDSVKCVMSVTGLSLKEANAAVSNNLAWSHVLEGDLRLEEAFFEASLELGYTTSDRNETT